MWDKVSLIAGLYVSHLTVDPNPKLLPFFKFEAWWEVARAVLIWFGLGMMVFLVYVALFNFIWWFSTLFSEEFSRNTIVFFSTVLTLLSLKLLKNGVQNVVDRMFFPDTGNLNDRVNEAVRILAEIDNRDDLHTYLTRDLSLKLQVDGIFLHQHPQSLLRYALTLPLTMGSRSMGYLTIGPKWTDRSFSLGERTTFKKLQDQVSLVLSAIELAETREEAERVSQLKSNFVTNISHQLHTPLNTVINSTGLVADGMLGSINEEQAEYLTLAVQSSEHLMNLLQEILDIAKIESGDLRLRVTAMDMNDVLKETLSIVKGSMLQGRYFEIQVDVAENLPVIFADRTRIRQVLLNILSNAIKFTPEGNIYIKIWENNGFVHVSVEDTGIGIAKENLALVFEDYQQVLAADKVQFKRRRHLGTGLGMPVSKALVELHGGQIWVESEQGKGSIFTFTLPLLAKNGN
jgi:signal transduction histidine kinase